MTEALLKVILRDLPDMPSEVAAGWLAPHAVRDGFGWPPPEDGLAEPWARLLMGRPLSWWRGMIWHCEALPMTLDVMSHATRFQVDRLIKARERGRDHLPDSQMRMAAVGAAIAQSGTWPVPPVAFPDSDGLGLVDGHHRLAALHLARVAGQAPVQDRHMVWIALPR